MNFRLEKTIPLPMLELDTSGSEVWEADIFTFAAGQSYLVEAESGKGKTTLLSMLFGLRKDYRGELYLDENNASTLNASNWASIRKSKISFVFQGLELFDDLTARDNIQLKNRLTDCKTEKQILEMAQMLHIDRFMDKKCSILSFGQKQRVAIIRALCQPFEFLLADECFSHIDKKNSETALALILDECRANNAGLIMTSLGEKQLDLQHSVKI